MLTAIRTSSALLFPLGSIIDKKKKKQEGQNFVQCHCCQCSRDNSKCLAQKSSKFAICAPQNILAKFSYSIRNILLRILSNQFV